MINAKIPMSFYDKKGELILLSPRIKPVETLHVSLVHASPSLHQNSLPTSSNSTSSSSTSYQNESLSKAIERNDDWQLTRDDENSYDKLADYWMDLSAVAAATAKKAAASTMIEGLAKHSMCIINYPDILESSIAMSNIETTRPPISTNLDSETMCALNEIVDEQDLSQDVISLNVDFSNEEEANEQLDRQKIKKFQPRETQKVKNTNNSELKELVELNPKMYTLELSTLSSSSLSSSSSSSSSRSSSIERIQIKRRHTTKDSNKNKNKAVSNNQMCNINNRKNNETQLYNQVLKPPRHSAVRRNQTTKRTSMTKEQPAVSYCDDFYLSHKLNAPKKVNDELLCKRVMIKKTERERCTSRLVIKSSTSEESNSEAEVEVDSACSSKTSIKASLLVNNYSPIKRIKPASNPYNQHVSCKNTEPKKGMQNVINDSFIVMLNNPIVENDQIHMKKHMEKQTNALNNPKPTRHHNYENMLEFGKQTKLKKLKELQKKTKQAELKTKTVKAIAQHNSFRYFSRHGDNETHPFIELLDDFLLVRIFSYLSTIEKLKLQFVCKRWHRIIWSNENSYKLFKSIEISDPSNRASHDQQTLSETTTSSKSSPKTSNSFKTSMTLSRFFRSNKKTALDESTTGGMNKSVNTSSLSTTTKSSPTKSLSHIHVLNVDLVLKFLLSKLLNRETHPLCLCVESIKIRHSSRLTDKSLELIANSCAELRHLSLRHCVSLKGACLARIVERCESLEYIDITGCYNITHLVSPSAADTRLVDDYIYLQFIDLSYCSSVNDQCVQAICKSCVFVRNLYLRNCKLITDLSVLYIAKYCVNLRELSLSQCVKITDVGIKYLANERISLNNQQLQSCSGVNISDVHSDDLGDYYENRNFALNSGMTCKQAGENRRESNARGAVNNSRYGIKYLSLAKCVQITDKSLIFLCKMGFFQHIKYLNLRGCTLVTDKFLKYFTGFHGLVNYAKATQQQYQHQDKDEATGLESLRLLPAIPLYLKSLDLSKCSITNKSIEYICRLVSVKPDILKRLSLRSCDNITDDAIKLLALYCRNLQHLNVAKCSKVTSLSLKEIKRNCKCCIIQHTNFSFC